MRFAAKVDANHAAIIAALRKVGATVQSLAAIGDGCPDALVGHRGKTYLFEFKNGANSPSRKKTTPDQDKWHAAWTGGALWVVYSTEEALDIIKG